MVPQRHQHFLNRLANFIKGSNTDEDREAFHLLYGFYAKKRNAKENLTTSEKEQLGEELFKKISRALDLDQRSPVKTCRPRAVRLIRPWMIAASLTFILMAAGAGYLWIPQVQQSLTAWIQVEKTVPPGHRQQYELPDGTRVALNAGSTLTYPRFFLGHSREVTLSGEAFFQVAHDAEHPFIIHSGSLSTRVLGTSFNVKAYEQLHQATVTVASGRVQVSLDEQVLSTLTDHQEISVDQHSGKFSLKSQVDLVSRLAWRAGSLVFDNTPLNEVLITLSNQYNVSFNIENADLNGQYLTAEFKPDASLWQVLDVIIKINKLNFMENSGGIIVSGRKPK